MRNVMILFFALPPPLLCYSFVLWEKERERDPTARESVGTKRNYRGWHLVLISFQVCKYGLYFSIILSRCLATFLIFSNSLYMLYTLLSGLMWIGSSNLHLSASKGEYYFDVSSEGIVIFKLTSVNWISPSYRRNRIPPPWSNSRSCRALFW